MFSDVSYPNCFFSLFNAFLFSDNSTLNFNPLQLAKYIWCSSTDFFFLSYPDKLSVHVSQLQRKIHKNNTSKVFCFASWIRVPCHYGTIIICFNSCLLLGNEKGTKTILAFPVSCVLYFQFPNCKNLFVDIQRIAILRWEAHAWRVVGEKAQVIAC